MEHVRLKPIPGVSGKETTAVTMKSIKELIAEEEAAKAAEAAKAEQELTDTERAAEAARERAAALAAAGSGLNRPPSPALDEPAASLQTPSALGSGANAGDQAQAHVAKDVAADAQGQTAKPAPSLIKRLFGR